MNVSSGKKRVTRAATRRPTNAVGTRSAGKETRISLSSFRSRVGIEWRADDNYARKFCAAVVDLLVNLDNFWLFGYVSKSNVKSSARH